MEFYTVFSINFPIPIFSNDLCLEDGEGGWWSVMLINLVREGEAGAETQRSGDIYN